MICISRISFSKECAPGLKQAKWWEDTFKADHQVPGYQTHGERCTARGGRPAWDTEEECAIWNHSSGYHWYFPCSGQVHGGANGVCWNWYSGTVLDGIYCVELNTPLSGSEVRVLN